MKNTVLSWLEYFNHGKLPTHGYYAFIYTLILIAILVVITLLMRWLSRKIMVVIFHSLAAKTKTTWDDHLLKNRFFATLANLIPLFCMDFFLSITFYAFPIVQKSLSRVLDVAILLVIMVAINRALKSVKDWLAEKDNFKDKPLQSYYQVVKIVVVSFFLILMISMLTNRSPVFFLTSLGAMTAIILLIFKDTILGFVGSVQLSANDMVRVGDWITMDNYGADGDVIEINLTTVKVSNFDKTITTIPTYSFISDSFKNWRGMQESGGRRIKRDFYVKIDTIKFASPELLKSLSKLKLLSNFIEEKEKEIEKYNAEHLTDQQDSILNGRKQTNSGLFRKYMEFYLQKNKHINQDMPLIVKQLPPTQFGVPIQIYCFCYSKEAAVFEVIQGDIFDHLFGAIKYFELEIFESPTGSDFRNKKLIEK